MAGFDASMLLANPITIKGARARLRMKHIISWGVITLSVTAFVCLLAYLTGTERNIVDRATAARAMMVPIIVIQGILLMLVGTGAVASTLAREREGRLLDYHRMTPMSPVSKILGFLFGLPAREYFLFALTLPFLGFAVVVGEFPLDRLVKFYSVFFTSVWMYHMTGMVAGMASSKPRFASMMTQGMVVMLYFVLPQLSMAGLTFFEFLTIRPVFFGMLADELSARGQAGMVADPSWYHDVPFFAGTVGAWTYTMLVQGFFLAAMFIVVHRKWRDDRLHPSSKVGAVAFYAGTMLLLLGNLWPILSNPEVFEDLVNRLPMMRSGYRGMRRPVEDIEPIRIVTPIIFTAMLIMGLVLLLLINVITPSRETTLKGIRRRRKLNLPRVPFNSDAASSRLATLSMLAVAMLLWVTVVWLARGSGIDGGVIAALPGPAAWVPPLMLFASVFLFVQAVRERFDGRVFLISAFLLWMLPFFASTILFAAAELWVTGAYVMLPFPPAAAFFSVYHFFEQAVPAGDGAITLLPEPIHSELPMLAWLGAGFYAALALVMQWELHRWRSTVDTEHLPTASISASIASAPASG